MAVASGTAGITTADANISSARIVQIAIRTCDRPASPMAKIGTTHTIALRTVAIRWAIMRCLAGMRRPTWAKAVPAHMFTRSDTASASNHADNSPPATTGLNSTKTATAAMVWISACTRTIEARRAYCSTRIRRQSARPRPHKPSTDKGGKSDESGWEVGRANITRHY